MKMAITSRGETLDSDVESRFSRSPFFVIVDTEKEGVKAFKNPGASAKDAACVDAVRFLLENGVQAIVTGEIGHNAFVNLADTPMRVYLGVEGTVREGLQVFKRGRLGRAKGPSVGFRGGLNQERAIEKR